MKRSTSVMLILAAGLSAARAGEVPLEIIERQFRELPMEAKRLTGPLFWLHGDESKERLEMYLGKLAESGNGCFTAESRPHNDWLGPRWFDDLAICLRAAKERDLKMWIFDEKWWPSQGVGGKVPARYAAKRLVAEAVETEGPRTFESEGHAGERHIATLAGRLDPAGKVEGDTLLDLRDRVAGGKLVWQVPAGRWQVMKFGHVQAPGLGQGGQLSVDGASRDCVEWFLKTVYQPHHDRFKEDFGKTIPGFFYDEPETRGDWGTDLDATLAAWGVDWKKAYVAYKFGLAGDEDVAARYQYLDAFAETWGRVMYGGMADWCRERGVVSMGHFMEHDYLYVNRDFCAGDMMRLQKYSDMGGLDLVCRQMYPGQRPRDIYQTPKLCSSISHVYGKADDLTMCEMFGAYGQDITYPQMKWLTDQMQVRGVNFMIPHSFNPRAPRDRDCPPYFYNGGHEPRYPLYRVYADYTSRLSLLLAGGRHVCPVAVLFGGISRQVGKMVTPEDLTSSLQDALYDCDWLPCEAFEGSARIEGGEVALHGERYRVLVVPPAEVIPLATLAKVRSFLEQGGIVVGHGFLPSKPATLGATAAEIAALVESIWGPDPKPGRGACRTNALGGRSYFLPEQPSPQDLQQVLGRDAGVPPVLEVLEGDTGGWLHVLHRVKAGRDVFLVCNQNHEGTARRFKLRAAAGGVPEAWDAMRNELGSVPWRRDGDRVEFELALEPAESVLVVFQAEDRKLPRRPGPERQALQQLEVKRGAAPAAPVATRPDGEPPSALEGCSWVWYPEGDAAVAAPPGTRFFRGKLALPAGRGIRSARFTLSCDNRFVLFVNGRKLAASAGGESWSEPQEVEIAAALRSGDNRFAIQAVNESEQANPAGLIGACVVRLEDGSSVTARIDGTWRAQREEVAGWERPGFDDRAWPAAREVAAYGQRPWGRAGDRARQFTASPVKEDVFHGSCDVPAAWLGGGSRVFVECDDIAPEAAASVSVNGSHAGGFLGRPFRLEVTPLLKPGANTLDVAPFAPRKVRLVLDPAPKR